VPKTRIAGGMYVLKLDGGETEPIGDRIIEVPDDVERTESLRDPRSGFTAYVPAGEQSRKGRGRFVTTGSSGQDERAVR